MVKKRSKTSKGISQQKGGGQYSFFLYIPLINKTYSLKRVKKDILIKDFQEYIELVCGIPRFIQRLHYLDMADLPSDITLDSLDIVRKATFTLNFFQRWERLIRCVFNNDIDSLLQCDVIPDKEQQFFPQDLYPKSITRQSSAASSFKSVYNDDGDDDDILNENIDTKTNNNIENEVPVFLPVDIEQSPSQCFPVQTITIQSPAESSITGTIERDENSVEIIDHDKNSDINQMSLQRLNSERKIRGEVALYIAAHLGRTEIISKLFSLGVNINCKTSTSYTPLQSAIVAGQYQCIDFLLELGAISERKTKHGSYALEISKLYGHTETERHLLMFEWQSRSKEMTTYGKRSLTPLRMDQEFDSKYPIWFNGPYSTSYFCHTKSKSDFSGTGFNAPKKTLKPLLRDTQDSSSIYGSTPNSSSRERKTITLSYQDWLDRKTEEQLLIKRHEKLQRLEKLREKEKADQERKNNLKKSIQKRENEKRNRLLRDEIAEKKKGKLNIYEDFVYLPSYERLILHQMFTDISIT